MRGAECKGIKAVATVSAATVVVPAAAAAVGAVFRCSLPDASAATAAASAGSRDFCRASESPVICCC